MTQTISQLSQYIGNLLNSDDFSDYGPNGLQVQGNEKVQKIALSVSATAHSVEMAIQQRCQCLIVHHGLFWKYQGAKSLTGPLYHRVAPLIKNNINLLAYHLPLDAHMDVGNAASLAKLIGLKQLTPFGEYKKNPLGVSGHFDSPIEIDTFKNHLEKILNHSVIVSCPENKKSISSMGIITGVANNEWTFASQAGLDSYLTGEISEYNWHDAKEANMVMFAGGHHATEQFGIQSLGEHLKEKFSLETVYIPSDNPA